MKKSLFITLVLLILSPVANAADPGATLYFRMNLDGARANPAFGLRLNRDTNKAVMDFQYNQRGEFQAFEMRNLMNCKSGQGCQSIGTARKLGL